MEGGDTSDGARTQQVTSLYNNSAHRGGAGEINQVLDTEKKAGTSFHRNWPQGSAHNEEMGKYGPGINSAEG